MQKNKITSTVISCELEKPLNKKEIILFNKKKSKNIKIIALKSEDYNKTRHYPAADKEWRNSIYSYNKNITKYLPVKDKILFNILKSYFNLYDYYKRIKITVDRTQIRIRMRFLKLSILKIFISKAVIKHTSDKAIITLYVYNQQKKYLVNKLNNIKILKKFKKRLLEMENQSLKISNLIDERKELLISPPILTSHISQYKDKRYRILLKKSLYKEIIAIYIKQLLHFNRSKFEDTYLLKLGKIVQKLYNKNVEFNIVNLKYIHLNSDIFTQSLVLKLRKRKNKFLKTLTKFLKMVKINKIQFSDKIPVDKRLCNIAAVQESEASLLQLSNAAPNNSKNEQKQKLVLNSIKHKKTLGVRIEVKGRLGRRLTAAKSIFKLKYKGSLKNIDSSYKKLSTVILRGNLKSNLQYTKINSKTRNGSFGIKGWLSSK